MDKISPDRTWGAWVFPDYTTQEDKSHTANQTQILPIELCWAGCTKLVTFDTSISGTPSDTTG